MKKYNNAVLIGKFMPPHKGHEYMIRFAQEYAENVYVIVDCLEKQTISPEQRKIWLEQQIQGITVIALDKYTPQEPADHPDFWNEWKKIINTALSNYSVTADVLVAAMDYGYTLSQYLESDFIPIDIDRESLPISATLIREDTFTYWDYLIDSAKPFYTKKIAFIGPESTGKSTCVRNIAKELNTRYVPEYAKAFIEHQHGIFNYEDVEKVAFAQVNSEKALLRFANRYLICDSTPLTTLVWCYFLFQKEPEYLIELVKNTKYDQIFLFDTDIPFVMDTHRQLLEDPSDYSIRKAFFDRFVYYLNQFNLPFNIINGNYEKRHELVISLIKNA